MIVTAIIFIVLGVLIKYGKLYFLLAGYNTMPKEEQAKYDIESIATVFRNVMLVMAFALIAGHYLSIWLENETISTIIFYGTLLVGVPYLLIVINSGKCKTGK